jgi:alcohol dehydrogenase class IV
VAFEHHNPVKIIFGRDSLEMLGTESKVFGKSALLVTGKKSMEEAGITQRVVEILKNSDITCHIYNEISPNPVIDQIEDGAVVANEHNCDMIIGLGGGSVIDSAKGVAVAAIEGGPIWRFTGCAPEEEQEKPDSTLPVISISTTSGTGSHVNEYTVVTNPDTSEKTGFGAPCMFPKVAIIDPLLMVSLPPRMTAIVGFDALVHSIEAYTSKSSQPVSDSYCEKAISLIAKNLPQVVQNCQDVDLRENMAMADTLAGLAISAAGVGLIHAIEHPISGHLPKVSHAEGMAAIAVQVMKFNYQSCLEKYARIAELFGEEVKGNDQDKAAQAGIIAVRKLLDAIGLKVTLKDIGVDEKLVDPIAKDAFKTMQFCVDNNPRGANHGNVIKILMDSF